MALAAARSELNPNRTKATGGHSQAWPLHHEKVTNRRVLSSTRKKANEIPSNQKL